MIKRVKCLKSGYNGLTLNKVYDLIKYIHDFNAINYDRITIITDHGIEKEYYYRDWLFLNMTTVEYRSEVIDDILK